MNTIKRLLSFVFIFCALIAILLVYENIFDNEPDFVVEQTEVEADKEDKLGLRDALVAGFEEKKELISLSVDLNVDAKWDESWGKYDLFHKSQNIRFYGTGIYVTDLNEITDEDIVVDDENRTVSVTIPKPTIKTITIDETKTEYEDVSKGWLRFGDIKLTSEQYTNMYGSVKEQMRDKMESELLKSKAEKSSEESVSEIFEDILKAIGEKYKVDTRVSD